MFSVVYRTYTCSDGTPVFNYAGAPCETFEEAQELAKGYENARIYNLSLMESVAIASNSEDAKRAKYIVQNWGEAGEKVCFAALKARKVISMPDFLQHCTACGGNWGAMFLSGIAELYPEVYEAIPNDLGIFAFSVLADVIRLCGVIY